MAALTGSVLSPRAAGNRVAKGVYVDVRDGGAVVRLRNYAHHLADIASLWPAITEGFVRREELWFGRQGEGWPPLSDAYRDWKLRVYGAKPMLVREGNLKESLTNPARAVLAETDHMLVLGSDDPVARYHQDGTSKMPARPVLAPLVRIMAGVARVLEEWASYDGKTGGHAAHLLSTRAGSLGAHEMLGSYAPGA